MNWLQELGAHALENPFPWFALLARQAARDTAFARRMAILRTLYTNAPLAAGALMGQVERMVGSGCFGRLPSNALKADLRELRAAGIQIGYSRAPGKEGYYLKPAALDPAASKQVEGAFDELDPIQMTLYRRMSPGQRVKRLYDMNQAARRLYAAGVRRDHPELSDEEVRQRVAERIITLHV